ncbi:MAG: hypothetical protein GY731_12005, partial [Gammaproteobacteria bacterium]|nr:hypothetical protein [Gammaproteobacteria bacterium]
MTTSILRVIAPIAVLAGSAAIGYYLIRTAPEPVRRPPSSVVPVVEVLAVKTDDYTVNVRSWGTVTPLTQSTLVSEAAGRIVYVAPNFRNGSFFSADEVLARIDPAEYRLTVVNIEATLQGVEARLAELKVTEGNLKKSLVIETQHLELADKQYRRHTALQRQGTLAQSALEQSEREYLLRRATRQTLNNSLGLIPAQRRALEADLRL